MRTAGATIGALAAVGALGVGYAAGIEVRSFTLRRVEIECLPRGHRPIRVLHLSDLHMTPSQHRKQRWLRSLADLAPDLVVDTGDNLAHRRSVPVVLDALGELLNVPGVFVFGSNDYFAPTLRNPARYLFGDSSQWRTPTPRLPADDLRAAMVERGWLDLTNTSGTLEVAGTQIAFAGVDDPHLDYDDLSTVPPAPVDADLRVGVTHAPYLRVLDRFADDGYDVTFAGHTHGGQLCLPVKGALVTNCDLEPARAKGLHRHPAASAPGDPGSSWLHVSAGAGTSPYAPVRFCCRPEATLATLVPVREVGVRAPLRAVA
ncbi:metallophosphoesterase [Nocardioides mangrovicus]|uniref:Metallophosphoesterase n=1 Tax=Nocardioides mangrovicus TaxID=2478913 RepID=A0A3L8P0N6_9ACTN|nr:metallophosphoesterase [Nocardioides mangrovicus]